MHHNTKRLFQYTVKDVARPASGTVTVDGVETVVPAGESWAVLDHGRGRWPYSMRWNWGAASGVCEDRTVGVQIGGKWTEGTGATENSLLVDGRLHKISEELVWEYDVNDFLAPVPLVNHCGCGASKVSLRIQDLITSGLNTHA